MKNYLSILCIILGLCSATAFGQVHVKLLVPDADGTKTETDIKNDVDISIAKSDKPLKDIEVLCDDLPANHKLVISALGEDKEYKTAKRAQVLSFRESLDTKQINIVHKDEQGQDVEKIRFKIVATKTGTDPKKKAEDVPLPTTPSVLAYVESHYPVSYFTPHGYVDPTERGAPIHLFFDQFGNCVIGTVPSGISNAQYIVHIIYPINSKEPDAINYSVKQKSGSFSSSLVFNNTNILSQIGSLQSAEEYDVIAEKKIRLATSTDDITFDIIATTNDGKINKSVLESYTIKMTPVFHGSFDVGFLRTNLANPDYSLVTLPGTTSTVVKQGNDVPRGVVTVMASFYVSPIILIESLFKGKRIPAYKLTGRNFLDDHKIYERFYPTIGIGVSDKSFENIFYGINWEVARGLCIFGGWHTGRVNTFDMPNWQAGVTPVDADEFAFYKNKQWKTSTAVGIKLDMMIVRNLFVK
jgi:hypothetical protein